jgi:hypothetical protein
MVSLLFRDFALHGNPSKKATLHPTWYTSLRHAMEVAGWMTIHTSQSLFIVNITTKTNGSHESPPFLAL